VNPNAEKNTRLDLTDEELVVMLHENELLAFKEIYTRYWYQLYLVTNRRLRSQEATEEILQNFFTTFWINRKQTRIRTSLKAYLYTAIRYSIINHLAREATRNNYVELIAYDLKETNNATEETVFLNDLQQNIDKILCQLPKKCRAVFELSRKEHKTNKEIAQLLNLSEKTVENHITNALKLFRLNLKETLISLSLAWLLHR